MSHCGRLRPIKDFRCRPLDTVLGTVRLRVPRYRYCKCGCDTQVCNPTSEVLSGRVTPELRHLQVSLGAQLSYRKAADLLRILLPPTGGTNHTTTRARLIAVGERIDEEIRQEIAENRKPDKLAKQMIIGIDGAFVKGRPPTDPANLEIITGRIEVDAAEQSVRGRPGPGWPCQTARSGAFTAKWKKHLQRRAMVSSGNGS